MAVLNLANVVVIPSCQTDCIRSTVDSIDRNREPLSIHGDDLEKNTQTSKVEGNGWTRRSTTQQQHGKQLVNGRVRDNRKPPSGICPYQIALIHRLFA